MENVTNGKNGLIQNAADDASLAEVNGQLCRQRTALFGVNSGRFLDQVPWWQLVTWIRVIG